MTTHTTLIITSMFQKVLLLIIIAGGFLLGESTFAEENNDAGCGFKFELPQPNELRRSINECFDARVDGTANRITNFVCPQGEFVNQNKQRLSNEVVAYLVAVNISLNKADEDIKKYMEKLQKMREKEATKWIENMSTCINDISQKQGISGTYSSICDFNVINNRINEGASDKERIIVSTDAFPQQLCTSLTSQKLKGWDYLGKIFMSDGINKSQKNDTDKWVSQVKGSYGRLLGKWHDYQKILGRAVSKMTGYNRQVVGQ